MDTIGNNFPEPQQDSAPGNSAPPKGRLATAKELWQQLLDTLPERTRPIFADPPSSRIEEFADYFNIVTLVLARTDCSDLVVLIRAYDLVQDLWQERALRRCGQAKIESEMRPAARALLQELLNDGERSPEELTKLANRYAYLAFKSQSGLAEVSRLVPGFELQLVEAEAIHRSFEAMEALSKIQAFVGAHRDKAIDNLESAVETAEYDKRSLDELLRHESEKAKKSSNPQQTKQ
jgi:hypothetical protein